MTQATPLANEAFQLFLKSVSDQGTHLWAPCNKEERMEPQTMTPPSTSFSLAVESSVKLRKSCDRCHGQKLRCIKREGNGDCIRCHRARAVCKYSPALRVPRLTGQTKEKQSSSNEDSPYPREPVIRNNEIDDSFGRDGKGAAE